jgi:hypothetical protein
MPPLRAKDRAALPDSAFAYIDSSGKRRLPINDAAHVRNALARFGQVAFEDEAAGDRARIRLLRAAKKHGIMPIGFISSQLEPQRKLPTGLVTFLLTDIEGSTDLLARLGPPVTRCPPAEMTSSRCSKPPPPRWRTRSRSSARCAPAPGRAGATCG